MAQLIFWMLFTQKTLYWMSHLNPQNMNFSQPIGSQFIELSNSNLEIGKIRQYLNLSCGFEPMINQSDGLEISNG